MRYEQYALALGGEVFDDLHQLVYFLRGKHSRRLVKYQYVIVAIQHLEYLCALLHAYGDILYESIRVNGKTVFFGKLHNLFSGVLLLQKAVVVGLDAKYDVVQNREAFHQLEVLVNHAYAKGVGVIRILNLDLAAILVYLALLRLIQPEKYAHKG